MKLFQRLAKKGNSSGNNPVFERLQVLKFIEARRWIKHEENLEVVDTCAFALVIDENDNPTIYVREREPEGDGPWRNSPWVAHGQKSIEVAEGRLSELIIQNVAKSEFGTNLNIDSKKATELGFLRFPLDTNQLSVWRYGYVEVDLESGTDSVQLSEETTDSDFIFSIGITIDQSLKRGWIPRTRTNWDWIAYYFQSVPLQAGFFGSFKFILKKLTEVIESQKVSFSQDLFTVACATLGMGYGVLDARASVAAENSTFNTEDNRRIFAADDLHSDFMFVDDETNARSYPSGFPLSMEYVSSLPGFNGRALPSLATLQYLMRKGFRFINSVDEPTAVMAFKAAALIQSIVRQSWSENCKSERQLLTARFCYEGSDLARLDRSARTIIFGSKETRDNYLPIENVSSHPKLLNVYHENFQTVIRDDGQPLGRKLNPLVAHYFLQNFSAVNLDINWTGTLALTMSSSSNAVFKGKSWDYLKNNPNLFLYLDVETFGSILKTAEADVITALCAFAREEVKTNSVRYYKLISPALEAWMTWKMESSEFAEREFIVFTELIRSESKRDLNGFFRPKDEFRFELSLLIQAIRFSPREREIKALETFLRKQIEFVYSYNLTLLELPETYGIQKSKEYPVGLLELNEILEHRFDDLITDLFVKKFHAYYDSDAKLRVIQDFVSCGRSDVIPLIMGVLPGLDSNMRMNVLESMFKVDASSEFVLSYTKDIISLDQEDKLLEVLTILSKADFDYFWRKNGKKFLNILIGWVGIKLFLWSQIEKLSPSVLEELFQNEDFAAEFLAYPSQKQIARMSPKTGDVFIALIRSNKGIFLEEKTILGLTKAPNAELNKIGTDYIKSKDLMEKFWLYLLESNFPVCVREGGSYLRGKKEDKNYADMLLSALDSDNKTARSIALELVEEVRDIKTLTFILEALLENRNTDTWPTIYKNLGLINGSSKIPGFTHTVFTMLRQARRQKEEIKSVIDELKSEISKLVGDSTILYMTRSSVAKDREWALRKVALGEFSHGDLKVEHAWSNKDV